MARSISGEPDSNAPPIVSAPRLLHLFKRSKSFRAKVLPSGDIGKNAFTCSSSIASQSSCVRLSDGRHSSSRN